VFADLEPLLQRWLRVSRRVEPQAANQPAYQQAYEGFCALHARLA
jgi:hypothetical protein